ncbi:unnamed protein product [Phaeothamnion confervicola]
MQPAAVAFDKIQIHLEPVANAPILKQNRFRVPCGWTAQELAASLRNQLKIASSAPLVGFVQCLFFFSSIDFLYVNGAFEPSGDQQLSDLHACFHRKNELLVYYSIVEAWG